MTDSNTLDLTPLAAGPGRTSGAANLYTELAQVIRDSGLQRRRSAWYWSRFLTAVGCFVLIWLAIVWAGDTWLQLLLAGTLGMLMTQFGFLGHDAAHRQVFRSGHWNDRSAAVCAIVFAGLSLSWWKSKHNRHHAAPNQVGRDPDIASRALAFTPQSVESRVGLPRWCADRQGWFFFPLLTLEGLNLLYASVASLWLSGMPRRRRMESAVVMVRLGGYVTALLLVLPPTKALAFLAVQSAVFGVTLGGSFAPNHKGMPIVPATARIDFLRRQVLMSRNIRGGPLVDFAMGGLNYQIEHHLFPSMPRPNLRLARPHVRDYCDRHGVSYTEVGLFESYGIIVDYLNNVGLRARDPFECPVVAQYR